jgi:ribosomal protein S18 acetylase RimI-like enzyme
VVRDARPEDAEAIARIRTRGWQTAYAHVFPAEALKGMPADGGADFWAGWLATPQPRSAILVAEAAGSVAGFVSVGPARGEDAGELYAIYVDPAHWGAGLGQALIQEAESRLASAGFDEAILWVLDDNPRARRFYEAAGWHADGGSKRDTFLDTEVNEVRYRKAWAPPTDP